MTDPRKKDRYTASRDVVRKVQTGVRSGMEFTLRLVITSVQAFIPLNEA